MLGTFNGATGFPLVLLIFFVIPAIWIAGVIFIGSRPRRLAFWTIPFVAFYGWLIFTESILPNRAEEYEITIEALGSDNFPFRGTVDYTTGTATGHSPIDLDGRVHLPAKHSDSLDVHFVGRCSEMASLHLSAADQRRKHRIETLQRLILLPSSDLEQHGSVACLPWHRELTLHVQFQPN